MKEIQKLDEQKRKIIEDNAHISDAEIDRDIKDTLAEIQDFEDEKDVLMRNPVENKTRIYLLEGKISPRKTFVEKLEALLELRNLLTHN